MSIVDELKKLIKERDGSTAGVQTIADAVRVLVKLEADNYTYNAVESPTGNPKTLGYYEKNGSVYTKTADTTVVPDKTYYTKDHV